MNADSNTLDFDATKIEPTTADFEPLPAGEYEVVVTRAAVEPLRSGNGSGLNLTYQVVSGPHKGWCIFETMNIRHTSPKASEIARRNLSALCRAVGVLKPHLCTELCNLPLVVKIAIQERDGYKPRNEVKAWVARSTSAPAAPDVAASTQGNRPSWM